MQISSTGGIQADIGRRLNEVSADNADTYLDDINQCTKDVQSNFFNAPFLQTSVTRTLSGDTSEYALPSDLEKVYSIRQATGNIKLVFLPTQQFDTIDPQQTVTGTPTIYTIINDGTTIKYAPIPASDIDVQIRYQKLLGVVSTASSVPPIPLKYNQLYVLYGEKEGLIRQGRREESSFVEAKYQSLLEKMIEDLSNQTLEFPVMNQSRDFMGGTRDFGDPIANIFGNSNLP